MKYKNFNEIRKKIINRSNIEQDKLEEILEYISSKNINEYLNPKEIQNKFNITQKETFEFFILLVKSNVLIEEYKIHCYKCNKTNKEIYKSINELEENLICEYCFNPIKMNNIYIDFKIIKKIKKEDI